MYDFMPLTVDGITFGTGYLNEREVQMVDTTWLMRNALHSVDFGNNFDLDEMLYYKCGDGGMENLIHSIIASGGIRPTGAIGFDPTCQQITEGHHRFSAAILLCLPQVPISRWSGGSDKGPSGFTGNGPVRFW